MSLSELACRHASPKPKPYKIFDSGGLYLEVRPSGAKIWRFKYRHEGNEKVLTFGPYPHLSLIKAREKRDQNKSRLFDGFDPSAERKEQKRLQKYNNAQTFKLIAEQWHKKYYSTWTPRYAKHIILRLNANVFPCFGDKPISKLTLPDIIQCVELIEQRKAFDMSRRILRIIGQIMRYAVITGRAERDLTPELRKSLIKYNKGHYASIDPSELPELVRAIYANNARLFPQTVYALKLLLLTFQRPSEVVEAKKTEFDLDKKIWVIPPERMKMKKGHIVPLSDQVVELLKEIFTTFNYSEYLLPSVAYRHSPISNNTVLSGLSALGYNKRMTGHGFRALAMGAIKENFDYRHEVIDRQLAHVPKNSVDRAYDRAVFLSQRTKMMQDWADYVYDKLQQKIEKSVSPSISTTGNTVNHDVMPLIHNPIQIGYSSSYR